ncbi:unnamed protein product [Amoebophrya sp. A120]|nr:unnamed protein product [Amoebophrya sp. A120]|eukprot:GSA120T00007263001.1
MVRGGQQEKGFLATPAFPPITTTHQGAARSSGSDLSSTSIFASTSSPQITQIDPFGYQNNTSSAEILSLSRPGIISSTKNETSSTTSKKQKASSATQNRDKLFQFHQASKLTCQKVTDILRKVHTLDNSKNHWKAKYLDSRFHDLKLLLASGNHDLLRTVLQAWKLFTRREFNVKTNSLTREKSDATARLRLLQEKFQALQNSNVVEMRAMAQICRVTEAELQAMLAAQEDRVRALRGQQRSVREGRERVEKVLETCVAMIVEGLAVGFEGGGENGSCTSRPPRPARGSGTSASENNSRSKVGLFVDHVQLQDQLQDQVVREEPGQPERFFSVISDAGGLDEDHFGPAAVPVVASRRSSINTGDVVEATAGGPRPAAGRTSTSESGTVSRSVGADITRRATAAVERTTTTSDQARDPVFYDSEDILETPPPPPYLQRALLFQKAREFLAACDKKASAARAPGACASNPNSEQHTEQNHGDQTTRENASIEARERHAETMDIILTDSWMSKSITPNSPATNGPRSPRPLGVTTTAAVSGSLLLKATNDRSISLQHGTSSGAPSGKNESRFTLAQHPAPSPASEEELAKSTEVLRALKRFLRDAERTEEFAGVEELWGTGLDEHEAEDGSQSRPEEDHQGLADLMQPPQRHHLFGARTHAAGGIAASASSSTPPSSTRQIFCPPPIGRNTTGNSLSTTVKNVVIKQPLRIKEDLPLQMPNCVLGPRMERLDVHLVGADKEVVSASGRGGPNLTNSGSNSSRSVTMAAGRRNLSAVRDENNIRSSSSSSVSHLVLGYSLLNGQK